MITNCKNCGAPLTGNVCEYCGTHMFVYRKSDDGYFGRYRGKDIYVCKTIYEMRRTSRDVLVLCEETGYVHQCCDGVWLPIMKEEQLMRDPAFIIGYKVARSKEYMAMRDKNGMLVREQIL